MDVTQLAATIDLDEEGPPRKYHGVDEERYEFLQRRLQAFVEAANPKKPRVELPPKETVEKVQTDRARRSDFSTLQEWTERDRQKEREYDAKRRARRRAEGPQLTMEERRVQQAAAHRRSHPPPSSQAMDTVICAMQALQLAAGKRDESASGTLAELEEHLKSRISRLKESVEPPR